MAKIIFRGAVIRYIDIRYDVKGNVVYRRIHMSADSTKEARRMLGMEEGQDLPDSFSSGKIEGAFPASHMLLEPNPKELRQHETQMAISDIGDFKLVRSGNEEKRKERLDFVMVTAEKAAGAHLENFLDICGHCDSRLTVVYAKQEVLQMDAPESDENALKDPDTGEVLLRGEAAATHRTIASARGKKVQ
jgi:hypothetical protein